MSSARNHRQALPLNGALATSSLAWVIGAIILLVAISHFPLRHSQYIQDDHLAIERNHIIEQVDLGEIFTTSYWEGARGQDHSLYRPVTIMSYALERGLTGEPDASVSQLINVTLHLLVSCALLFLALRLGVPIVAAVSGAVLFAVHPVHLEAVANIVGRAELLAALFTLLALWCLTYAGPWGGPAPARNTRLAAWGAALMLFLALGSKEIAMALPALFIALELLLRPVPGNRDKHWWLDRAAALAPMVVACELYLWLRTSTLEMLIPVQRIHPLDNLTADLSGIERWATSLGVLTRYLEVLCWPATLAADYSGPVISAEPSLFAPRPLLGLLALLVSCVVVIAGSFNSNHVPRGVAFWVLLFLLPYLIIGNLLFPVGTIFAERLIYLPSAGVCLLVGLLIGRMVPGNRSVSGQPSPRLKQVIGIMLIAGLTLLISVTWQRAQEWRDDETVFTAAARVNPLSPRSHFILGKLAFDRGDMPMAIEKYRRTIALYPEHGAAWLELGNVLASQQRFEEAEASFLRALEIVPQNASIHFNLALATRYQHRLNEAERWLFKARLADDRSGKIRAELGNLYLATQRYPEAVDAYREALTLGYGDATERLRQAERLAAGER